MALTAADLTLIKQIVVRCCQELTPGTANDTLLTTIITGTERQHKEILLNYLKTGYKDRVNANLASAQAAVARETAEKNAITTRIDELDTELNAPEPVER